MKKLRRKTVLTVFLLVTAVFALTVFALTIVLNVSIINRADRITDFLIHHDGKLPDKQDYDKLDEQERIDLYNYDEEAPYLVRYFSVKFDGEDVVGVDIAHIASIDKSEAAQMAFSVKSEGGKGDFDSFRYRISENGTFAVFVDCSANRDQANIIVLFLTLIAVAFIVTITLIFAFVSKQIVRPFEENRRMQKQFITDASHELKTPVAIISANAEVLSYKYGENEWLGNITAQTERMSGLINEMLTLNRLEEVETVSDIERVNLSEIITKTAEQFDEMLGKKKVLSEYEVPAEVFINGNPAQLDRLFSVVIENAAKYVSENGRVKISLKKDARHVSIDVFDTCEINPDVDYKHLFDRFYRPDSSRTSKTGGHGIGLSIAKRISVLHNGSIAAVPDSEGLHIKIRLSSKLKPRKVKNK